MLAAAPGTASAPASAPAGLRRVKILPVLFVLILGLQFPFYRLLQKTFPLFSRFGWSWSTTSGVYTVVLQMIIAAAILLVIHFWERLPMSSVGIVRFAASDLALGVAAFIGIGVIEALALPLVLQVLTGSRGWRIESIDARQFSLIYHIPWPLMLAVAASAGIFEEIWARGYAVERLEALTGSTLAAAAIALALDLGAHVPFWGFRYPVLIAPGQILLLGLYLWRRRLAPCVIAHFLWDSGRPIVFAALWLLSIVHPMPRLRGELALSIGDYDQSIAEFSIALRQSPNDTNVLQARSNAYFYKHEYDQAIDDLSKVIKLNPGSEDAYR
ncbi:MAG: CPBP family glutamic-type intramembrane protease, partial [Candidatus Binataceae bacterium]